MNCRYYTERVLSWMLNNKLIVFLSLLSFCLFVSTLALSGQKGRLQDQLEQAKSDLTSTTTEPTPEGPGENQTEETTANTTDETTDSTTPVSTDATTEETPTIPDESNEVESPNGDTVNPGEQYTEIRSGGNPVQPVLTSEAAEEPPSGRIETKVSENDNLLHSSKLLQLLQV